MGGKRRVENLAGQNQSNEGGRASLYVLRRLTLRVKYPYSNPNLMTRPHRWTQKWTIMKTSIRQIYGWMNRGWIRIKINLHSRFSDLPCNATWRKLCKKTCDVRNGAISSKILQINQFKQQDLCRWCCYGGNCGGAGVAIVVIMEVVMERQGWQKWWWCGSVVAGFIIFAPVQWAA